MFGSSTWTRTTDPMINRHVLYQLSYRGIETGFWPFSLEARILPVWPEPVNRWNKPLFVHKGGNTLQCFFQIAHAGGKGNTHMAGAAKGGAGYQRHFSFFQ